MEVIALLGTVIAIHLLAVITPGPDFVMCVRNSLAYSRKIGMWTAVGFGIGIIVHIIYSVAGLALVISQSILVFNAIKFLGAGYLIYIGMRSFFSKTSPMVAGEQTKKKNIPRFQAVKMGFLTNVLNPKATLFFLSLFTLVISPETPMLILVVASIVMVVNTIVWFSLVAILLTQEKIRSVFERYQSVFNKFLGGVLVALGIKVVLTSR
jgi:RhtB (resistance to homoserine/threonine) family protein